MENLNLLITLCVLVFMIISFLVHKISYGLTAMTCVIILALTGVVDVTTAFSGLSNTTTILVATMLVIAGAIGKTSIAHKVRQKMAVIQGKNGFLLLILVCIFSIVLTQIMGQTAMMSIMLLIAQSLDDDSDLSPSRVIFLAAALNCAWFGRIPVGMGAALPFVTNGYYEGLLNGQSEYLLSMFDIFKAGIIPSIAMTIYCLLAWRLIPKTKIDSSIVEGNSKKEQAQISSRDEKIIFGVFIAVMIAFIFSKQLSNYIYIIPTIGVLVLLYTKALTTQEVMRTLAGDMVWMVAGILVISSALSASGAAEFVGNLVLNMLGSNPSSILVISVFCIVTTFMTTFLSNNGTIAVMVPIAVSTALAGGMNPKAVVLVVQLSACLALAFPTGCAAATMAFAIGRFNPIKTLKFSLPFLLIGVITIILSCSILFPVY